MANLKDLIARLKLDTSGFDRGLEGTRARVAQFGRQMQMIGTAASAAGAGIAYAIQRQIAGADQMGKAAQSLGLPVDVLSQLSHAAQMSGATFEDLQAGLRGMANAMATSSEKFEKAGISVRDGEGRMRPAIDVLRDLSDRLASMPDGADKTALAMSLMTEAGIKLIPTLNGGSKALNEMMAESDSLGKTVLPETAKAAASFNDNIARLIGAITGLAQQIAAQLAPVLDRLAAGAVEVSKWFRDLSPEMQRLASVIAVVGVVIGPLLIAFGTLVTVLAAIASPALVVVAVITALSALVVAFWPEIVMLKDKLVELGSAGIDWVVQKFTDLAATVTALPETVVNAVAQVAEAIRQLGFQMVEALKQAAIDLYNAALTIGTQIVAGIKQGILDQWEGLKASITGLGDALVTSIKSKLKIFSPSRVFQEIGRNVVDGLVVGIDENAARPADMIGDMADKMTSRTDRLADSIASVFWAATKGGDAARSALSRLLDQMGQALMNQAFRGLLGGLFGGGSGGGGGLLKGLFGGLFGGSFEGGGFTGTGARSGGIDGRGGFAAILHPGETVIDHMRAGMGSLSRGVSMPAASAASTQQSQVDVRVSVAMQNDGKLQAFVEGVSTRVVRASAPEIVRGAVQAAYVRSKEEAFR